MSQNPDPMLPLDSPVGTQSVGYHSVYANRVDLVLDSIYHLILRRYKSEPEFLHNFTRAEAAWLNYRNAEMQATIDPWAHGTDGFVDDCYGEYRAALTRTRIGELLMWLNPPSDSGVSDTSGDGNSFETEDYLKELESGKLSRVDSRGSGKSPDEHEWLYWLDSIALPNSKGLLQ